MIKLLKYLKIKEWTLILISFVFIVIQVWLDLKIPEYMSKITTLVKTPNSQMSEIWTTGGYMLLCAIGSLIGAIIVGFIAAKIGAYLSKKIRSALFDKVQSFSMGEINKFSTPSLITRSTNDVTQYQMFITISLQMVVKAPIMAIWAIKKIEGKGIEWSIATAIAVLILLVLVSFVMLFVIPKFKKIQTYTDNLNRVSRENLTGLRVVRAYNAEDFQKNKFEKANKDITKANLFTTKAMSIMMPSMMLIMNLLSLSIYWIGTSMINNANLIDKLPIFSNMVVFSSYAMQIIMSFVMLVMMFVFLPRASVSAKRINEILKSESSIIWGNKKGINNKVGEVIFNNVSFKYPDAEEYILKDISFKANKGETIAFIGSTGSGKSTLINLVPRFFDATDGEILIDGINIKEYRKEDLNNKIGYVPQKAILFKGTVSSNVGFGDNGKNKYTKENIDSALKIAQASDFVNKMDKKTKSLISQGGTNISGGQKQRIAIARAVCRKPEIYIFDDSFSALDYKTDRILRSTLKKETKGITTFIVAQRIGTIIDADQIIVLEEGKIVGKGTHDQLLKKCKVYKEIALSQLSKEELKNERA